MGKFSNVFERCVVHFHSFILHHNMQVIKFNENEASTSNIHITLASFSFKSRSHAGSDFE